MSQKKGRRSYTPEQKAEILRRHLVDKQPVSDLCDEYKLQPSLVYTGCGNCLKMPHLPAGFDNKGNLYARQEQEVFPAWPARLAASRY